VESLTNVFIPCGLSQAMACAFDLVDTMHSDLDLDVNLEESWVYAPACAHLLHTPPAFHTHCAQHPNLVAPGLPSL
jgi:hypothetical protein